MRPMDVIFVPRVIMELPYIIDIFKRFRHTGAEVISMPDIIIKKAETKEELDGKAFVHWKSWQEA